MPPLREIVDPPLVRFGDLDDVPTVVPFTSLRYVLQLGMGDAAMLPIHQD